MESLISTRHEFFCHHGGSPLRFDTWADFTKVFTDPQANLVFRWDWCYGTKLRIFMVQQRKGKVLCAQIAVSEADEPAVRKWLSERLAHLVSGWHPVTDGSATKPEIVNSAASARDARPQKGTTLASPGCRESSRRAAGMG